MSRQITISKLGDTTIVKIVDNGKTRSIYCNSSRDLQPTENGIRISNDPNETTLNNFEIKITELTNDGIDFSTVVTPEDLLNVLATNKAFKKGGGLGADEVNQLIFLQQADSYNSLFVGNYIFLQNYDYEVFVKQNTMIAGNLIKPFNQVVTLQPGDVTYDRIDLVVINSDATASVIQGIPSANPSAPDYDADTQVVAFFIIVTANSITQQPTGDQTAITNTLVYDENVQEVGGEWDAFTGNNPIRIDFASPDFAYSGIKSIKMTDFVGAWFKNSNLFYGKDVSNIMFRVRIESGHSLKPMLVLQLWNTITSTRVGKVYIQNGNYGLDTSKVDVWQEIIVPATELRINKVWNNEQFDEIILTNQYTGTTIYVDDVNFQSGTLNTANNSTLFPTKLSQLENDVPFISPPLNPVLNADYVFNNNAWVQKVIPTQYAPYFESLVPDSNLPSTDFQIILNGAYFTPTMTVAIDGQTINSMKFISDNQVILYITSGAAEGNFSITLDNGISVTYPNALSIVLGTVTEPKASEWINQTGQINISTGKDAQLVKKDVLGTAQWNKILDITKNWYLRWNWQRSPLDSAGTGRDNYIRLIDVVTATSILNIRSYNDGNFYIYDTDGLVVKAFVPSYSWDNQNIIIDFRWINGAGYLYFDNVLQYTFSANQNALFVNNLNLGVDVKGLDTNNIKHILIA